MNNGEKVNSNESFDKMSEALNTEFDGAIIESKLDEIEEYKTEVAEAVNSKDVSFEDKEYLQMTLKAIIASSMHVMEVCAENIKIGSNARDKEVYFNGAGKLVEACKELRELNRTIADINIKEKKVDGPTNNLTVNMKMSGRDMLKYLNNLEDAQKKNQLKEISTDFDTTDGN